MDEPEDGGGMTVGFLQELELPYSADSASTPPLTSLYRVRRAIHSSADLALSSSRATQANILFGGRETGAFLNQRTDGAVRVDQASNCRRARPQNWPSRR